MGSAEKPPLVELENIRDTFVTGIGDIEILGHNARITLYVDQGGRGGAPVERVVVAKLLVTLESIPSGIKDVVMATRYTRRAIDAMARCRRSLKQMVH
jgi:hypothetical protein